MLLARLSRTRLRALARKGGFTLVEMLMTMVILSIIMTPLSAGFVSAMNHYSNLDQRATSLEGAVVALHRMRLDIHCASAIPVVASNGIGGYTLQLVVNRNICNAVYVPSGSTGIQWCTVSGGEHGTWILYRENDNICDGINDTLEVDDLTSPNLWSVPACPSGENPTVQVTIPVNPNPALHANATFTIKERITLRNYINSSATLGFSGCP